MVDGNVGGSYCSLWDLESALYEEQPFAQPPLGCAGELGQARRGVCDSRQGTALAMTPARSPWHRVAQLSPHTAAALGSRPFPSHFQGWAGVIPQDGT